MNERTFLKLVAENEHAKRELRAAAVGAFNKVAADEEITIDELSRDKIDQLAEAFVERGLNETL